MHYDAIVIGGGHNGLTAAAYSVARAARSSCSNAGISSAAPRSPRKCSPDSGSRSAPTWCRCSGRRSSGSRPAAARTRNPPARWHVHADAQRRLPVARERSREDAPRDRATLEAGRRGVHQDGKAMVEMARFVKPILNMTPPDPTSLNRRDLLKLLFMGRRFQGLADTDRYNQVQLMTMSAVDFLDQWFETDVLKATMSASGIIGTFLGVRSPGTVSTSSCTTTWARSTARSGRGDSRVAGPARFRMPSRQPRGKRASRSGPRRRSPHRAQGRPCQGVVLKNGDEIDASLVISSVDPNLTFLKFLEERDLPGEFVEEIRRYKYRGSSGKVNLALDAPPDFTCLPGVGAHLRGAMSISPSVDYMERAYDQAKYGEFSKRPISTWSSRR